MHWSAAIVEITKVLGPAIIIAIFSFLTIRLQYKTKVLEIKGQAALKAREILFASYQKKIESVNNSLKEVGEFFGKQLVLIHEHPRTRADPPERNGTLPHSLCSLLCVGPPS